MTCRIPSSCANAWKRSLPLKNHELAYYGLPPARLEDLLASADRWREKLGSRIVDSVPLLHDAVEAGRMSSWKANWASCVI